MVTTAFVNFPFLFLIMRGSGASEAVLLIVHLFDFVRMSRRRYWEPGWNIGSAIGDEVPLARRSQRPRLKKLLYPSVSGAPSGAIGAGIIWKLPPGVMVSSFYSAVGIGKLPRQ